jgi:hypothetical protein
MWPPRKNGFRTMMMVWAIGIMLGIGVGAATAAFLMRIGGLGDSTVMDPQRGPSIADRMRGAPAAAHDPAA